MKAALLTGVLAAGLLTACETWEVEKYNVPIAHKYPVPEGAPQACVSAASDARKWCRDQNLATDTTWTDNCRRAQWSYNQHCR